jgi:predicted ArsR family transcriptional regulator
MDFFDRRILAVLKAGRPKEFPQLVSEVGFSHNTLRLHLARLEQEGLVLKEKSSHETAGRPRYTYSLPQGARQASSVLIDPYSELVVLTFEKLQHLCRHEKGRYCKEMRNRCEPQNCPQIIK